MRYCFDAYEIDATNFQLLRDGLPHHVEPLVLDLLIYMCANPGMVLSRDALIEAVWRGRIVSDATVSACIKAARKALGDSGAQQRYVQTVRGRGIRFTANPDFVEDGVTASGKLPEGVSSFSSGAGVLHRTERRLSAILAMDMVGYSRLIEADEAGTIAAHQGNLNGILKVAITEFRGRVIKTTGDGLLVEFASVVDAVEFAIEVQTRLAEHPPILASNDCLRYRIGINVGDIVADKADILGDGVNVASRIESLADPGGLVLSGNAYEHVKGKLGVEFVPGGSKKLKNMSKLVDVWHWQPELESTGNDESSDAISISVPDKPSIAVLPFDNMSGDSDQEYFSDGITEDIISSLSKIKWLFVIARNSTFTFKGKATDIRVVARKLGVRYILEGSVRKAGNRVRIAGQLIEGATGSQIWSNRFDREMTDIFVVQDEITEAISGALDPVISGAEWARSRTKMPENLDAWDLHLRGLQHLHRRTEADLEQAASFFDSALALDPTLVPALAAKEEVCYFQIVDGYGEPTARLRAEAVQLGLAAVQLDDGDPFAHFALGRAYTVARKHDFAISPLRTAIDLNPSYAWANYALGMALATNGHATESIEYFEAAMRLSPHDPYKAQFLTHTGSAHLFSSNFSQAVIWAKKALEEPKFRWSASSVLISALGHLGKIEEAQIAINDLKSKKPEVDAKFALSVWPIGKEDCIEILSDGFRKAKFG